jgi:hypothetical protein
VTTPAVCLSPRTGERMPLLQSGLGRTGRPVRVAHFLRGRKRSHDGQYMRRRAPPVRWVEAILVIAAAGCRQWGAGAS